MALPTGLMFIIALLPLIAVAVGMLKFKQPGDRMAVMGWALTAILAGIIYKTSLEAILGATLIGLIKSLGVTLAVAATMYQIFLMKEVGALTTISEAVKRLAATKEEQALFVGLAFGSFLTALGVVTPALLPPLLVAMGFTPFAAIAISVLGYNATTSFALLSIPVTLPAEAFGFSASEFAWKISIFLPIVSIGFAFGLLWLVGGKESMRKGAVPAILAGGAIALVCILTTAPGFAGIVPLRVVGVVAGAVAMVVLVLYQKFMEGRGAPPDPASEPTGDADEKDGDKETKADEPLPPLDWEPLLRALSPWIILVVLAFIISIPAVDEELQGLLGEPEVIHVFDNTNDDLNIGSQIYTWIIIATLLSFLVMKPTGKQKKAALTVWRQRVLSPCIAYSFFFAIALVMFHSGKFVRDGDLIGITEFKDYNMNVLLGNTMSSGLGDGYLFAAAFLGLFGGFAGGSETGSNVLFYGVQKSAAAELSLSDSEFMTLYGSHAVAGGIASGITPAKINNATAVLGADSEMESAVLQKHLVICFALTVLTGLMTVIFIKWLTI